MLNTTDRSKRLDYNFQDPLSATKNSFFPESESRKTEFSNRKLPEEDLRIGKNFEQRSLITR